jgi:integrase
MKFPFTIASVKTWAETASRGALAWDTGPYTGANVDEVLQVGCHALRRSYASFGIQAGVDLMCTKSLLNHTTSGGVTMNSYVSLSLAARTEAAQRAADFIETRLMGLSPAPLEVLPLLEFQPPEALEPSLA